MKQRDFRSLDENTQAELRRLAILHISKGKTFDFVAELIDVHVQTVRGWFKMREILELMDFKGYKRGRNEGEKRILKKDEELNIKSLIETNTPDKLNLGSALWTRRKVRELIKNETYNNIPLNTVGKYLRRWGFTAQRPGKVANEQDQRKILKWIQEEYPKIEEMAEKENAEIYFSDETGVSLNTYYGKTYSPIGVTPNIKLPARKSHISMISGISNLGLLKFMIYKGGLDNSLFIEFIDRLTKDANKKIFLILDNLQVHKSKVTMEWVSKHSNKISLFFPTSIRSSIQPSRTIKQYLKTRYTQKSFS